MAEDRDLVIGHDVGTGGNKAVLADVRGNLIATSFEPYPTSYPRPHWAEQDPEDWWKAVSACTRRLFKETGADPARVLGIGFAGQMADTVPVDEDGNPLTPVILWLDSRADAQAERIVRRLGGRHVVMRLAGALPTGKDVVSKWIWLKEEEPRVFARAHKLLDSTGYLVMRATGVMQADHTGAGSTGILNNDKRDWEPLFVRLLGLPRDKLPDVKRSIDVAGPLTARAAEDLGLPAGTPVVGGQADIPSAAIGSGALADGDAHVYLGTSSWLCISVAKARRLGRYGIAAVASADPEMLIMIGETETAGACLQWFADNLAGAEEHARAGKNCSIFQSLDETTGQVEPGAGRLIFCPWMFGERSPVPDTTLRGAFLNLSLEHKREHMLRAVYEGVAYNLRWLVDAAAGVGLDCRPLRAIGGGACSDEWMQILADVTCREVEAVEHPQEAGAVGVALTAAVAMGVYRDLKDLKQVVRVRRVFRPRPENKLVYEELYAAFRAAYPALSRLGRALNH